LNFHKKKDEILIQVAAMERFHRNLIFGPKMDVSALCAASSIGSAAADALHTFTK